MRALVTGSRGFVGTHLVAHLNACADDVIEVDRVIGSPPIEDASAIAELIAETKPDAVYHLAGQSDVAASWSDPMGTFLVNADGTLNVVRACIDAGVERLLAVTSSDIYGMVGADELPITEHAPLRPVNPYAASKAAAEMVCIQGFLGHGLGVIRARAFNHLGPGQSERFLGLGPGGPHRPQRAFRHRRGPSWKSLGPTRLHRRARRGPGLPLAGDRRRTR